MTSPVKSKSDKRCLAEHLLKLKNYTRTKTDFIVLSPPYVCQIIRQNDQSQYTLPTIFRDLVFSEKARQRRKFYPKTLSAMLNFSHFNRAWCIVGNVLKFPGGTASFLFVRHRRDGKS